MGFSLNFRGFAPRRIGKFKCVQMPFRAVWNTSEKLCILPLEKNHQPFLDVFQTCKVVNDAHNEHVCLSSCLILPFFSRRFVCACVWVHQYTVRRTFIRNALLQNGVCLIYGYIFGLSQKKVSSIGNYFKTDRYNEDP